MRLLRGLLVANGKIEPIEVSESTGEKSIRSYIGNVFTTAFRIPRGDLSIDGYCDDEFLLRDNPNWNVVLEAGVLYHEPYPIAEPLVILGGNNRTGESISLTAAQMHAFSIDESMGLLIMQKGQARVVPLLRYKEDPRARNLF